MLAPNAKLRASVVPPRPPRVAQAAGVAAAAALCEVKTAQARPRRICCARLLKRVFDIDLQRCPNCGGGELMTIAAIHARRVIQKILDRMGPRPSAATQGPGTRAGAARAAFRRLIPVRRRRPIAIGCTATPQPGRYCAARRRVGAT